MSLNPIVLSIPLFFILIGIELVVERIAHRKLYRLPDAVANISCGITSQISGIFMRIFGIGVYEIVYANVAQFTFHKTWVYWLSLFLLVDFAYYWAHRMSHEINLFWGGHVVHHQSEEFNLSVALRQSSFQVVWTFAFNLPLAVIGFETLDFLLVSSLITLYQFWIHTETIGKMGWFEIVFNTPSHHRVHHGRNPKYIDKNHAGTLIIWDRMFGTFQKEEEHPVYGITTPMQSWNPVWANVKHYNTMWAEFWLIPVWRDRLKYLFKKPGWLPEYMGGYRAAPEIFEATYEKYETPVGERLSYYVLFQYALSVIAASIFIFWEHAMTFPEKIGMAVLLSLWVVICGVLFEQKVWVRYAEWMRIPVFGVLIGAIPYFPGYEVWQWVAGGLYSVISFIWFYVAIKK